MNILETNYINETKQKCLVSTSKTIDLGRHVGNAWRISPQGKIFLRRLNKGPTGESLEFFSLEFDGSETVITCDQFERCISYPRNESNIKTSKESSLSTKTFVVSISKEVEIVLGQYKNFYDCDWKVGPMGLYLLLDRDHFRIIFVNSYA